MNWDDIYEECKNCTDSPSMTRGVIEWLKQNYTVPSKLPITGVTWAEMREVVSNTRGWEKDGSHWRQHQLGLFTLTEAYKRIKGIA